MTNEQLTAKLLFQIPYSGAYGCLSDIEAFGRPHKAAGGDDFQKRTCKFGVHARLSIKIAPKCNKEPLAAFRFATGVEIVELIKREQAGWAVCLSKRIALNRR